MNTCPEYVVTTPAALTQFVRGHVLLVPALFENLERLVVDEVNLFDIVLIIQFVS